MIEAQADSDVVIVGAGIGGAVLGLSLAVRGWKIKLLEREAAPLPIARPEVLWGPTPAALDRFGVGEVIRQKLSVRIAGIEMTRGDRRLIAISRDLFESTSVAAYSTDPAMTRQAILDAAIATGNVSVVRGAQVSTLAFDNGMGSARGTRQGVEFEERARLIVGDDGVHSVVRTSLGIPIDLKLFPLDFVTAAIPWPDELPPDRARIWWNPAAFRRGVPAVAFIPWPGRRGALLIPLVHERVERMFQSTAENFWSEFSKLTPLAASLSGKLRFPVDFKHVRRPYGHAPRYVGDWAAIIGDAAHPMSPAGGQGANASIWDALALADVAHEGLAAGDLSRQRLDRYEAMRRPSNNGSVTFTYRGARAIELLGHTGGLRWLVPALLRTLDHMPSFKRRLLLAASTTFVTR